MQIGAENRKKVMWAGGLGVAAVLVVAYQMFSSPGGAPVTAAQPVALGVAGARPVQHRTTHGKKDRPPETRLDPTLDLKLLAETEQTKYNGTGRNIFVAQAEAIPNPIAKVQIESGPPTPPQPPPPPPPPAITLKYFGFANKPGEPKKAFLSQGEDIFIAVEGEIVNRRYKVIRIGPASVEIEDVLYNNRQSIPLTQSPQG